MRDGDKVRFATRNDGRDLNCNMQIFELAIRRIDEFFVFYEKWKFMDLQKLAITSINIKFKKIHR